MFPAFLRIMALKEITQLQQCFYLFFSAGYGGYYNLAEVSE